uniref:Uncharacterized protein n=1 Tax=Leersia perrieri TaxID=77586 RepID=A0A0D9WT66_9ORYZ
MENPAIAHPRVPVAALRRRRYIAPPNRGPAARRSRQLIVNSGVFLISTAGAIVVVHTTRSPSTIDNDPAYALLSFLLFLLGIWLVIVAFVAGQFPRAARVALAIARTLQNYLIGGN